MDKKPQWEKNSDKWWDNWWKNNFSAPNDPESFNFAPILQMIADKLGINSIKGFVYLIIGLVLLGLGINLGLEYLSKGNGNSVNYQSDTKQVIDSWVNYPELRPAILIIFVICILGALLLWWFFYKDS